ncbi:MAG TPA: ion channel [Actinomycetes bacterium]|jgi:voltage-gated potassium channel|nr:ion channel [Actinomycetes bacterium]
MSESQQQRQHQPARPAQAADARTVVASLARTALAVAALLFVYFLLPLTDRDNVPVGVAVVVVGMSVFGAIFVRQLRQIRKAEFPVLRAVEAIALVATLFVVVMASVHYGIAETTPDSYSEVMSRLDALYFTVTTLATVGYGDITPTSDVARAVTTVQMVMGVVLLGVGVRLLVSVAQKAAEERRGSGGQ